MFEDHYFKDSKISNYKDYTQKRYNGLFYDLVSLGIKKTHKIIDFGCATGLLIKEFVLNGFSEVCGTDVSFWAINYGRSEYDLPNTILQYLNYSLLESSPDWIICLDVLEHIGNEELDRIIRIMNGKKVIVRVPVCNVEGEPFCFAVSRNDKTHVQCHTKNWWINKLSSKYYINQYIELENIYDSDGVLAGVFNANC